MGEFSTSPVESSDFSPASPKILAHSKLVVIETSSFLDNFKRMSRCHTGIGQENRESERPLP